jgi:hypothetical protein
VDLQRERRSQAHEGVAREALTALHAFEQKSRLERLQFQIGRYRCIEIGGDVEGRFHSILCSVSGHKKTHLRHGEDGFLLET